VQLHRAADIGSLRVWIYGQTNEESHTTREPKKISETRTHARCAATFWHDPHGPRGSISKNTTNADQIA